MHTLPAIGTIILTSFMLSLHREQLHQHKTELIAMYEIVAVDSSESKCSDNIHTQLIFKRSSATKLKGFSLGQAYMADHYKSLSHSGDGSKLFFPDPLPKCSDNNSESFDALPAIDPPQALGRGELQFITVSFRVINIYYSISGRGVP